MRRLAPLAVLAALLASGVAATAQRAPYRTLNDTFEAPRQQSAGEWQRRAAYLREHILASSGLLPMPERAPIQARIFGEVKHADYSVSKVYFESLPGFLVTGNLYKPAGTGPFPAILSPHGHWSYGRLEHTSLASVPGRAINLARQGFVVFSYDMIGYVDSQQLPHTFGGPREHLWGLSLAGLQLWNAIRGVDFLESLPFVRAEAIGATGASGGGTQTFLLAAVDDRVRVAAPVNMISLHMQGGCLCENPPGLRLDTTNVELAATIAPRPLLMVSATGDWTKNTIEEEYPAVRAIYELLGAADRVHVERFDAPHNYHQQSREAVYAWMARWLQDAPADVRRPERSFSPGSPADLLVFHMRPVPPGLLTPSELTHAWIAAATRQLAAAAPDVRARALRHALGYGDAEPPLPVAAPVRTVLLAGSDPDLERQLRRARMAVQPVAFTAFDAEAAETVRHFETYNRTPASLRVADIVAAVRANPGAAVVASGDAALAALLASAIAPPAAMILDVGSFDTSSDREFVERLYIPGLRRAGDLQTAATLYRGRLVVHGAGGAFALPGVPVERQMLDAAAIVRVLAGRPRS
jgi:hypothetical protein